MKQYVGLDVSLEETSICIVDELGNPVWQGRSLSTPTEIAKTIRSHGYDIAKIGLESVSLSTWHWHELKAIGLPVVCLDARHSKAALSMQVNKTDANDAYGLAQIVRTGWYREVKVKSMASHSVRTLINARHHLVNTRKNISNQVRGMLKTFGLIVGKVSWTAFDNRVQTLVADNAELSGIIHALMEVWRSADDQLNVLDRKIKAHARRQKDCHRLMTIPGIGPITAMTFMSVIDDPNRFAKSTSVGAYIGLTPRLYQSGEVSHSGRTSKCGDRLLRSYLFEAATVILTRIRRWSSLKAWALRLVKRAGINKARVALARKLAVIMHRMWIDGSKFQWSKSPG